MKIRKRHLKTHLRKKDPRQAQQLHSHHAQAYTPSVPRHAAPIQVGGRVHQPYQGAQVGRYRADNIQYRTNLLQQSVGSHSHEVQATEQRQHQQLHQPSSHYAHT